MAGGVNLYAYAGNNPIAFGDPFGLFDVTGGEAELQAYHEGKNAMAVCALLCGAKQAADAQKGLAVLNAAENDHSINIKLQFGGSANGTFGGTNEPTGSGERTVTVNPQFAAFGARKIVLGPAVAHEVYESYEIVTKHHNLPLNKVNLGPIHRDAVQFAEDPALLGEGLPSRTSRSPYCDVGPLPNAIGGAAPCHR